MDPEVQAVMARSAQLQTHYGGSQSTMNFGNLQSTGSQSTSTFNKPAPAPSIGQTFGKIAGQAGAVAGSIGSAVGHAMIDPIVGLGHNIASLYDAHNQDNFVTTQTAKLNQAMSQLRSQRATMRPENYANAVKALNGGFQQLSDQMHQNSKDMPIPSFGEVAGNLAGTLTDPFAVGKLAVGAKVGEAALAGSKVAKVVQGGEKLLQASNTPASSVVSSVLKAPIKNVFNQATVQTPGNVTQDIQKGDYVGAAAQVGLPLAGMGAAKILPKVGQAIDGALYGNSAGPMVHFFGAEAIHAATAKDPALLPALQQAEGFTLSQHGVNGDPAKGAQFFQNFMENVRGLVKGDLTPSTFVHEYFLPYAQTSVALDKFAARHADGIPAVIGGDGVKATAAMSADKLKSLVVSADYTKAIPEAVAHVNAQELHSAFGSTEHAQSVAQTIYDNLHLTNIRVRDDIAHAIQGSQTANQASLAVEQLLTKHTVEVPGLKAPKGFVFTEGPRARATMPGAGEGPALTEASGGQLRPVGRMLEKAGLSTRASDNQAIAGKLKDNFGAQLEARGITTEDKGAKIYKALQESAATKMGSFDASSLTKRQISSALQAVAPDADPKTIRAAFISARAGLPMQDTGIAQKAFNNTLGRSPLFNKYLKVQAVGKFEMNPAFWAKQDLKGAGIAAVHGWHGSLPTKETQLALMKEGVLSSGGGSGEDASLAGSFQSSSGATTSGTVMRMPQQQIVGGLAEDIAKAHGTTPAAIMATDSPLKTEMLQHLKLVTSYGDGGYLNSPMAKSLNMVIFPSRFATKVGMAATKAFSDSPPAVQFGVIHAISNTSAWLNGADGQKWQKDNADFIKVVKYMTPLAELDNLGKFVGGGFRVGDLGQLGGLPVGVVSTMLQHQGVDMGKLGSSGGTDPSTGLPYTNNIPQTTMARFQQAFTDLVGSMFSYPGATVGLPSKTKVIQGASGGLLKPALGSTQRQTADGQPAPARPSAISMGTPADSKAYVNPTASPIKIPAMQSAGPRAIKRGRVKTVPANMIIR